MKYKLGQKLRIVFAKSRAPSPVGWNTEMDKSQNTIVTVTGSGIGAGPDRAFTYYCVQENGWSWDEKWLVPLSIFRIGDTIKVKSTKEILKWFLDIPYKDEELVLISRKQLI